MSHNEEVALLEKLVEGLGIDDHDLIEELELAYPRFSEELKNKIKAGEFKNMSIREKNAPIVETLLKSGTKKKNITYGLQKGEIFIKGVSGGKRRKTQRKKKTRKVSK